MSSESLETALDRASSPVDLLRNIAVPAVPFIGAAEYSNWRTEQEAWRTSVVLLDQSHHMNDLFVSGPDALRLFTELGVNSFDGFVPDKAKQFVAVNHEGYYIGDNILFYLGENQFNLVGQPFAIDWVQFNAETGGLDVEVERDPTSVFRGGRPPKLYRYELQGPQALALLERLVGQPLPSIKFFNMGHIEIAGRSVRALRHGMAGQPGFEMFGPWEEGDGVLSAILELGDEFGLERVGTRAYATANLESGWMPALVPGIYTSEALANYRRWLPASSAGSVGGSFYSDDVTDYYVTPFDLGYRKIVSYDHDFVGRDKLKELSEQPAREKVTLMWDGAAVEKALGSILHDDPAAKYIDLPKARYATHQYDRVEVNGRLAGFSSDCGYLANERAFVSLATVDAEVSEPGTEVTVVWGEDPISAKPLVEPHVLVEIPAVVAPAPLPAFARTGYRAN